MKNILLLLVVVGAGVAMYVIFSNDVEKGKEEEPYDIKEQKKRAGSQSQAEEDKAKDRMGSDKQTEGQPGSGWPTDPASIPTDPDEIRGGQEK